MRAFILIAALMHIGLASAQDGALEINQACVENGCFEGDTRTGFPVYTQGPGLYRLTSNLVVPAGTQAISAFATEGQAVLDLNGFSIIGPNSCEGQPVSGCTESTNFAGVRGSGDGGTIIIRNGHISGFREGVSCEGACVLEGLTLSSNSSYGATQAVGSNQEGLIVRRSTFESNGNNALRSDHAGTMITDSVFKWNAEGPSVGAGSFRDNVVSNNGAQSFFGSETFLSRNVFVQSGAPFTGGFSNKDNMCDDSSTVASC